jgi:Protein of unknown function (DUF3237)
MIGLSTTLEFTAQIELGPPAVIGASPAGFRRVVPIVGGTFEGPHMRGTIEGGADWQYLRTDGAMVVSARYLLTTDDAVLIQIDNNGIRHGPPDVIQRLANGESVDPGRYYFRTRPEFAAPNGRYDWLNTHVFVATAARQAASVQLEVYRIL